MKLCDNGHEAICFDNEARDSKGRSKTCPACKLLEALEHERAACEALLETVRCLRRKGWVRSDA